MIKCLVLGEKSQNMKYNIDYLHIKYIICIVKEYLVF